MPWRFFFWKKEANERDAMHNVEVVWEKTEDNMETRSGDQKVTCGQEQCTEGAGNYGSIFFYSQSIGWMEL